MATRRNFAIFTPLHIANFAIFVMGFFRTFGAFCHDVMGYPVVFILMEIVSFITILSIWILHSQNWLLDWKFDKLNERQKHVMTLYRAQTNRIFCYSVYIFILQASNLLVGLALFRVGDKLICSENESSILFKNCSVGTIYFVFQNFSTMQTAGVVRHVFIKMVKKKNPEILHDVNMHSQKAIEKKGENEVEKLETERDLMPEDQQQNVGPPKAINSADLPKEEAVDFEIELARNTKEDKL